MNVYGYEGQLGCAAITLRGDITSENAFEGEQKLVKELEDWITTNKNALPSYAVPRFLRILTLSEDTCKATQNLSTAKFENGAERVSSLMKKRKVELRKEGMSSSFNVVISIGQWYIDSGEHLHLPSPHLLLKLIDLVQLSLHLMKAATECIGSKKRVRDTLL